MTLIRFEDSNISNIQNKFKQENNKLLEEIKIFHRELLEVKTILNTPNSSKIIPEQIEILEKMEEYIRQKDAYFENIFEVAKNQYNDFNQNIKSMIGDVNE